MAGPRALIAAMVLAGSVRATSYSQAPDASKDAKEAEKTCRILGMVVKLADGTPIKNATVQLDHLEDRQRTIATKTTGDGRFELKSVPAGQYKLTVMRNGYVSAQYGQKKSSDPGAIFALSAGGDEEGSDVPVNPGGSDRRACL